MDSLEGYSDSFLDNCLYTVVFGAAFYNENENLRIQFCLTALEPGVAGRIGVYCLGTLAGRWSGQCRLLSSVEYNVNPVHTYIQTKLAFSLIERIPQGQCLLVQHYLGTSGNRTS